MVSYCLTTNSKSAFIGLAAASRVPPRAVLTVHARGTHGREEEEDVARGGEMAAENKPEGLKKIRNPDRMYRSAVCYAGHAPPKGVNADTEMNNEHGHLKIYLPKKLLECLPKCSSLPKERHRWNTNELRAVSSVC
ncbi:hypothetical protein AALO_G00053730 [Alosa alosa]|uniref:Calmodulin-binding transcription activator 1 n=1 Tax=Alosa alosa TaxID=278164 RepID=A0AAV6H9H4_9TELE|nr:hypothetical protein AALO_G00053730 [Alosa alosa]